MRPIDTDLPCPTIHPHRRLRWAIEHDQMELVVRLLIRGNTGGREAYRLACQWGRLRCVQRLARVRSFYPPGGWLPAIYGDQVAVIQWMAEASIWMPTSLALTAAAHGSYYCLRQLVEWGIAILPPNIIDWTIRTAITHRRPVPGLVPTLDLLLRLGYEVDPERHPLHILLPAYRGQPHLREAIRWAVGLDLSRPQWQEIWMNPRLRKPARNLIRSHCPFTKDPPR